MVLVIKILGYIFARLDTTLLEQIVSLLAKLFFIFPSARKETLLSNLRYAFPSGRIVKFNELREYLSQECLKWVSFRSLTLSCLNQDGGVQSYIPKIPKKN